MKKEKRECIKMPLISQKNKKLTKIEKKKLSCIKKRNEKRRNIFEIS